MTITSAASVTVRPVRARRRSVRLLVTALVGGVSTIATLALGAGLSILTAAPASATVAIHPLVPARPGPFAGLHGSPSGLVANGTTRVVTAAAGNSSGYWEVASDGGIFAFGDAGFYGSLPDLPPSAQPGVPVIGLVPTANGKGYWEVTSKGDIYSFGDAPFYGSTGSVVLNKPIVGMATTPDGKGYWLVASDGGVFAFGDAKFYGSMGGRPLNKPIIGMTTDPVTGGYWCVASDGGIFSFHAPFYGSMGGKPLNKPIVGITSTPSGGGYYEVASDGGIFSFGTAPFDGSMGGRPLNKPIVAMAASSPSSPPLSITTTSLPSATEGTSYSSTLSASGGTVPYAWSVVAGSLPPGLSLSTGGTISGTPSSRGSSSFTVQVTDSTTPSPETASATLSISVAPAPTPPLSITTTSLPSATAGSAYSATLSASGGTPPYSWRVVAGSLPPGLSLSTGGTISGTPSSQGSSSFTVQVTDSTTPSPETASATLSISVAPAPVPTVKSSNWSGYVVGNGPFTGVTGTFTVTSLYSGDPSADRMAEWVGIGGGNGGSSIIQAGIVEYSDPNNPNYFYIQPWWETYPAPPTNITTVSVAPGDQVTVTIEQVSGTDWAITLTDNTNGESFTTDQTYSGTDTSAEWIVEAPETTLAPYTPDVTFSDLGTAESNTTLTEWIMVQAGNQVSTPSALTSNGFNVAYGDVAPAGP